MVDWQNPNDLFNELKASHKFAHVVDGVYLWEFICNLGFEYGLLRGRRQWRWTAALYIACRVCTIFHVTGNLAGMSSANQSICKLWLTFSSAFQWFTISIALSLYALRTIAVYRRSVFVTIITFSAVLTNVIAWVFHIPPWQKTSAIWEPRVQGCLRLHTHPGLLQNGVMVGSEAFFLMLMAGGIYMHKPGRCAFKIMYREGLLWLALAALMQAITLVFFVLDFNDSMNSFFVIPTGIFTSIGATRMYRTLSDTQTGDLLSFWETSQDETTGAIRFRRRTWVVPREECQSDGSASTTALQMASLSRESRPTPQSEERFLERFEARDIELDVESKSMRNGNHCIIKEGR